VRYPVVWMGFRNLCLEEATLHPRLWCLCRWLVVLLFLFLTLWAITCCCTIVLCFKWSDVYWNLLVGGWWEN